MSIDQKFIYYSEYHQPDQHVLTETFEKKTNHYNHNSIYDNPN